MLVQKEVQKAMDEALKKRLEKNRVNNILSRSSLNEDETDAFDYDVEDADDDVQPTSASASIATSSKKRKVSSNVRGPMDVIYKPNVGKIQQTTLDASNPIKRKLKMEAWMEWAKFSYECGIPFNVVRNPRFQRFIYCVGEYGRAMPAPSYHNVRVTLLQDVLKETKTFVDSFRPKWKEYGCSIMSDFWTYTKGRSLINFLVNCPQGTVFLKSVDASDQIHDADYIVGLINEVVADVGEENIVQFIMDNGSNFKAAGKKLEIQHPKMCWTPCAAHCINLILQEIGSDIEKIKNVLHQGRKVVVYIYNHLMVLNMMRKLSSSELHRPCVTRFATSFYTLESIWKNMQYLQQLFVSSRWVRSSFSKREDGKNIARIIAKESFWKNVELACKVLAPLVDVLRLVDREEQPCMGYIYDAMDRAKLQLDKNLADEPAVLVKAMAIVTRRWVEQLEHPLHAAGYYLNPAIFYKHSTSELNHTRRMLNEALMRLVPDMTESTKILSQLLEYREATGDFGTTIAIRTRETISPYEWWISHGNGTPKLQSFVRRVLSQTCSASPCERNWSAFDNLHTKKRNCLLQAKLNDLVYIQYNMKLERRFLDRKNKSKTFDPIVLRDVEENDDWITPTEIELAEFVRVGDDLTWEQVRASMGADDVVGPTTRSTRSRGRGVTDSLSLLVHDDQEDEDEDEQGSEEGGEDGDGENEENEVEVEANEDW